MDGQAENVTLSAAHRRLRPLAHNANSRRCVENSSTAGRSGKGYDDIFEGVHLSGAAYRCYDQASAADRACPNTPMSVEPWVERAIMTPVGVVADNK